MPPKKAKAKAQPLVSRPPVVGPAVDGSVGIEIELRPGEMDNSNFAYIHKLADAWACIQDHDVFRGIQSAAPFAITEHEADSGNQHPFELIYYTRALPSNSQTCTAGINLFWIDFAMGCHSERAAPGNRDRSDGPKHVPVPTSDQ